MRHRLVAPLAAVTLAALAGGCGFSEGIHTSGGDCAIIPSVDERIDWKAAPTVPLTIGPDGEFTPMILHFDGGEPTILAVFNADTEARMVNVPGFLDTAFIDTIRMGDVEVEGQCLDVLVLAPRASAEVRLVPRQAGRYLLMDQYWHFPVWGTGEGVVYVDQSFDWR